MRDKRENPESGWIEKHIHTYYALLRSSEDIYLRTLEGSHSEMESNLHQLAGSKEVDVSAFLYSAMRLPDCMDQVKRVVMGQSEEVFCAGGLDDIFHWRPVRAQARRRMMLFDGDGTLAAFVSSISDIDDLVPSLTAFQIEWNKIHELLAGTSLGDDLAEGIVKADAAEDELKKVLALSMDDWVLLKRVWGESWNKKMAAVALGPKNIRACLLASRFSDYRRAVQNWWNELVRRFEDTLIEFRPVYIVSSNIHSLANMLSGFAAQHREDILRHALDNDTEGLRRRWRLLEADGEEGPQSNFLYYAMQGYLEADRDHLSALRAMDGEAGIVHYEHSPFMDLQAQIIDLRKIRPERVDPRLHIEKMELLSNSRAMILNINYPLGFSAYHLLSQIVSSAADLRGIYIMGKAATMSGRLGDVMIPGVVYDDLSRNIFFFKNCFTARDLIGFLRDAAVFDNQKSITVRGTFLQNREMMKDFHRDDYNGVEMEAGPYLCAIYENMFPERYPIDKSVNLQSDDDCDIGILHYASDTPYSRRESLLSERMGYAGVESTYACTAAILRRIFEKEIGIVGMERK